MWIEIFKSGTHTDSKGNRIQYSSEDIDNIIFLYNDRVAHNPNNAAPLVKGHPKSEDPALGWVERLAKRGNIIVAKIVKLDSQLVTDIKNERYKHFSIAITNDLHLRHIGIMGAVSPAIKDLNKNGIISFNENNESNFSEFGFKVINKNIPVNISSQFLFAEQSENIEDIKLKEENEFLLKQIQYTLSKILQSHNVIDELKSKITALEKSTSTKTFQDSNSTPVSNINITNNDVISNLDIRNTTSNTSPNNCNRVPTSCDNTFMQTNCNNKTNYDNINEFKNSTNADIIGNYLISKHNKQPEEDELNIHNDNNIQNNNIQNEKNIELIKQLNFAENSRQITELEIDFSNKNINQERLEYHNKILQYIKQNPNTTYSDAIYLV